MATWKPSPAPHSHLHSHLHYPLAGHGDGQVSIKRSTRPWTGRHFLGSWRGWGELRYIQPRCQAWRDWVYILLLPWEMGISRGLLDSHRQVPGSWSYVQIRYFVRSLCDSWFTVRKVFSFGFRSTITRCLSSPGAKVQTATGLGLSLCIEILGRGIQSWLARLRGAQMLYKADLRPGERDSDANSLIPKVSGTSEPQSINISKVSWVY